MRSIHTEYVCRCSVVRGLFRLVVCVALYLLSAHDAAWPSSSPQIMLTDPMVVPREGHTATVLSNGCVLITGGMDTNAVLKSAEVFDPTTGKFIAVDDMTTARIDHTATLLINGKVLIAGGQDANFVLDSAELFEPTSCETGSFRLVGSMTTARSAHTATLLPDGSVLVAGGDTGGTAEVFDPATESFIPVEMPLAMPRFGHSATLFADNSVLLAGGGTDSVEFFDAVAKTFTLQPQRMTMSRSGHSAISTYDSKLFFFGGDANGTVERYDSLADTFSLVATLGATNTEATLLASESILVLAPSLAGVFNVPTASLTQLSGASSLRRSGQTATEIPSLKMILVAGGSDSSNNLVRTAALFNPAQVETDRDDYPPGGIVYITGSGFLPGETVEIVVRHVDGRPNDDQDHVPWQVVADATGSFETVWAEDEDAFLSELETTAKGQASGLSATTRFTDATSTNIGTIRVAKVGPANIATGASKIAIYAFSVHVGGASGEKFSKVVVTFTGTNTSDMGTVYLYQDPGSSLDGFNTGSTLRDSITPPSGGFGKTFTLQPAAYSLSPNSDQMFYIVVDVKSNAVTGNAIDFRIDANAIGFNSGLWPPSSEVTAGTWNPAGTTKIAGTTSTTTTEISSPNPSVFGQPVTFSGQVNIGGEFQAAGTLTFLEGAAVRSGPYDLSALTIPSFSLSNLTTGVHIITAQYSGIGSFDDSSANVTQTVNKASTSTAVTSSFNPSVYGQSVTFTATVSVVDPGAGTPTGTVTFKEGATTLGTGTLNGSGRATFTTSSLSLGTHTISAVYSGDGNFNTSTSDFSMWQTVTQASSATALASGVNPSVFGQSMTFTATVTAVSPGSGTPTGNVTFKEGAITLGTGTLNGSAQATFSISSLSLGSHTITAVYGGDGNFITSTSSVLTQTVNKAASATAVTSSFTPAVYGQSVTFTATVSAVAPGAGTPTGTVTFKDGATTLGTGTLSGARATFSISSLFRGTHSITAIYSGNANFTTNTSPVFSQTVNKATTSITLGSSLDSSVFGQSVTFTAIVSVVSPGAGAPSGGVAFKDGETTLGTGFLDENGRAIYSTSSLSVSVHSITAVYNGDGNFTISGSSVLTQTVNQAASSTLVSSSSNTTFFGQPVLFTATVTAVAPGDGVPSGSVTFKDGATTLDTETLDDNGQASFDTSSLAESAHFITAVYGGDDSFGTSTSAVLTQTVNHVVQPPQGKDDRYRALENKTLSVAVPGVLANDVNVEGSPMIATLVNGPSNGELALNTNGSFTYTPATNFFGSDSFTYLPAYELTNGNVTTVSITVAFVNQPPVANNGSYSMNQGATLMVSAPGLLANDTDPDSQTLTATLVGSPAHGTVTLSSDGAFSYTPSASYSGSDSFTYFDNDGTNDSNVATVTITVNHVDHSPVANADDYSMTNTSLTVAAPGVLLNDSDLDDDPMTAALITSPSHGSLVLNTNGSFTYNPTNGFSGIDTFQYKAATAVATSSAVSVTIHIGVLNQRPVANDNSYDVDEETSLTVAAPGVLTNDTDADNDSLTVLLAKPPAHGNLSLSADGSFDYTPDVRFSGTDSFLYQATDGKDGSALATVTITVHPVNHPPLANNKSFLAFEGEPLVVAAPGVLANDFDVEGDQLTAIGVSGSGHGQLTLNADGSFMYTPATLFSGTDSFTYRANDGLTNGNIATVSITVLHVNQSPVANNDAFQLVQDGSLTADAPGVLTNDVDPDGDALSAELVGTSSHGSLTFNDDGSFIYTPAMSFTGTDSFAYQATDGTNDSNVATVTIHVRRFNEPPVATNDTATVYTNSRTNLIDVLANDYDPDNDALSVVSVTDGDHGTVAIVAGGGALTYTPTNDFVGNDTFTYTISDGLETATADVNVSVIPKIDDADLYTKSASFAIDWVAHALGHNNDIFTISGKINPRNIATNLSAATVAIKVNGTLLAAPQPLGLKGSFRFSYLLNSSSGAYQFTVSGLDLRQVLGLANTIQSGVTNVTVEIEFQNAGLATPVLTGELKMPYSNVANQKTSGKFGFAKNQTLTGAFNFNKTSAKQGPSGGFVVNVRGIILAKGSGPVVPNGDITLTVGGEVIVIPRVSLVSIGAAPAAIIRYSPATVINGLAALSIDNNKHTMTLITTELAGTGLPQAGTNAPTKADTRVTISIPTATGPMIFETTIELLRSAPTSTTWKR